MRKKIVIAVLSLTMVALAGCRQQPNSGVQNQQVSSDVQSENDSGDTSSEKKLKKGEKTVTGKLDEVKDFMFTITVDQDTAYAFAFEEKPKGLDDVRIGQKVTVTYTGELSMVDAFRGEVVSVERAK